MSNELAKFINSRRRHKTDVAIAKQVKIAKLHGLGFSDKNIKEPHRMSKHHAMDCGIPGCPLCGNPRHSKVTKSDEKLTAQEKRLFQDLDKTTDRKSNGIPPEDI